MDADRIVDVLVDGVPVQVAAGAHLLEACDAAGRYVPRLCYYPRRAAATCGLCVVRLSDGSIVPACTTAAALGMEVTTDDEELRALRRARLAPVLARHPHVCLTCPDRDGCARDECSYGNPPETRCCDESGRCELGKLVAWVDTAAVLPHPAVAVARDAVVEGRIRREAGLCIGCGRCVRVCEDSPDAGCVLELVATPEPVARPKQGTLRASGCTFCGRCVLVCPAGALTAPGEAGARWLAGRRERAGLAAPVVPPEDRKPFSPAGVTGVAAEAGVFRLFDGTGGALRISGVDDLRRGLREALADPAMGAAVSFQVEIEPLFTQRESELLARYAQEHGHLPAGNDLGDELFDED